jgi:hypothetical protein
VVLTVTERARRARNIHYMKHELFEELDAFDPKWQEHYLSLRSAALAANCLELYDSWRKTPDGARVDRAVGGTPDYLSAIKTAQEAAERLPFNIGTT